jgi:hypothetical protein
MMERAPSHPYDEQAGFSGRGDLFLRLRRQLTDPAHSGALCVLGRRRIGKTAFLQSYDLAFEGDFAETHVGVYVALRSILPCSEQEWWLALAQTITERLIERQFTLTRLSDLAAPGDDVRAWFATVFLPPVLALIRPHRRLVLLLDDADVLVKEVQAGALRANTVGFLRELTDKHLQLHIVLTLDTAQEALLRDLAPLVRPTDTARLTRLSPDETAWLLASRVSETYRFDESAYAAAYGLTGGEPVFVKALGAAVYRRYANDAAVGVIMGDDVKRVSQEVFRQLEPLLRETWDWLGYAEQSVLRAISQLLYADPLRAVDADAVAAWLVDSDDPMDATTVGAALRSLEYREVVLLTPQGIRLSSDLMQRFLLENAYNVPLAAPPNRAGGVSSALLRRNRGSRVAFLLLLVAVLVVGILILNALSSLPRDAEILPSAPTVTLFGQP